MNYKKPRCRWTKTWQVSTRAKSRSAKILEKLLADETIPERQDLEGLKPPISKLVKVHRWTAIHRRSDANPFHEVHPASTAWSQLSGRLLAGEGENDLPVTSRPSHQSRSNRKNTTGAFGRFCHCWRS